MNFTFSFEKAVNALKRFFLLIIVLAIGFYALGYYLTKRSTSVSYYSYTELYIHTISTNVDEYAKYMDTEANYVDTYLLTIDTYKFYEELKEHLPEKWKNDKNITSAYLKNCVSAAKRDETAIIRFTVYTYNQELTNDVTKTLSTFMDDYLLRQYSVNSVQVVEEPRPATASVSQNRYLSLFLAALGALIAFAFGYIMEMRDTRIKNIQSLEAYGVPILGSVPSFDGKVSTKTKKYSYSGYETYSDSASKLEDVTEKKAPENNKHSKKKK